MATKSKASAADTKATSTSVEKKAAVAEATTEKKATTKKAVEAKAETKTEVKAAEKKEPAKKAVAKKPAAKKTAAPAKQTAKKTVDIEVKTVLQFHGKEVVAADILETVKTVWVERFQGKLEDIKTIEIYIKPEEHRAYFVVNGLSNGDYFVEL